LPERKDIQSGFYRAMELDPGLKLAGATYYVRSNTGVIIPALPNRFERFTIYQTTGFAGGI
jgi:hypothetical protein